MTEQDMASLDQEVQDFRGRIKKEAEQTVLKRFPRVMLELDTLLNTEQFSLKNLTKVKSDPNIPVPPPGDLIDSEANEDSAINTNHMNHSKKRKLSNFHEVTQVSGTKVLALPNGVSPCNPFISEIVSIVKPRVIQLVEDANTIKMWILFLIPRIEDGNNFGVSIQEDTLGEVRTVEQEAATYFDQVSRYYISRGKIVAKIAKYPHVEDFRRTLEEIDEKEFLSLRLVVCELRNHYATLHDMIVKNLEKIKKPRNSNTDNMY